MELIPAFDPTSATSGSFVASTLQTGSKMIINNKSYVNMIFTFSSGDQRTVLANDRRAFTFGGASSVPGPNVNWEQESIDYPQTINQLQNLVYIEIYAPTETVSEKYPAIIQRETLPSLVPYNLGHGSYSLNITGGTQTKFVIWPSSYPGVTCAPQTNLQGFGFDHYWMSSDVGVANPMIDIPGSFNQSTGKTQSNASINDSSLASYIPGPFSKPGLTPVDSSTYLNGTFWTTPDIIPWSTATTGLLIDCWVNIPSPPPTVEWLWGDENVVSTNKGVSLEINNNGNLVLRMGNGTTHAAMTSNTALQLNTWYYVVAFFNSFNSTVSLYINGSLDIGQTFTGPVVTGTHTFGIGQSTGNGGTFVGSITNIGILLSNIESTGWGSGAIQARYLLGQQSLNQDYQNAWINGLEINLYNLSATNSNMTQIILQDIFNPAGLLFGTTPSVFNSLHKNLQAPGGIEWILGQVAPSSSSDLQATFYNPKTHYNSEFPYLIVQSAAGSGSLPYANINVHGFNILGIR